MNGLEEKLSEAGRSKLAVIGFPFDHSSSYMKGTALAPPLIREAFNSQSINLWSEAGTDLGAESIIFDAGDLKLQPAPDAADAAQPPVEETFSKIERALALLLDYDLPPISLGGDHSITYPIIRALSKKHSGASILHFDAHPDLYDEFKGSQYSHACPFARIMEGGLAGRLVQVGIRTMNGHQREQAERFGVEVIEMKDWRDDIKLEFDSPLYISFDVDALDPAFAPGVSHYEPGGFTTRQAIRIIQTVSAPAVVGSDIVEHNPARDESGVTAMVCAKIMKELAARMLEFQHTLP